MSTAHTDRPIRIAVVGEFRSGFAPHEDVEDVLSEVAATHAIAHEWVDTRSLEVGAPARLAAFDAVWISPGSPYASTEGALEAIRVAREGGVPILGTCGGFQHMVLEFARNALGIGNASHAEMAPDGEVQVVTALACSTVGEIIELVFAPGSYVAALYDSDTARERSFCSYGLNPAYAPALEGAGFRILGHDSLGAPRVMHFDAHPFFLAALYVPRPTGQGRPHPLLGGLLRCAVAQRALAV